MKKVMYGMVMFGFLASFTRAVWEPVQLTADAVGETGSKTVAWLNGGE